MSFMNMWDLKNKRYLDKKISKKYNAEYTYIYVKKYEEFYNKILDEMKTIIDIEKLEKNIKIELEGIPFYGKTYSIHHVLSIKFELSETRKIYITPVENNFKTVIYCYYAGYMEKELRINFEKAIEKMKSIFKEMISYGYFDEYKNDEMYYLEALKEYDQETTEEKKRVENITRADILIEKVKIDKIEDEKLLSKIYFLKYKINEQLSELTGIKVDDLLDKYMRKSLEYDNKNQNVLVEIIKKDVRNIIKGKIYNDDIEDIIQNKIIAIKNLEYKDLKDNINCISNEKILELIKENLISYDEYDLKPKFIELYNVLLDKLINSEAEEEYIEITSKILRALRGEDPELILFYIKVKDDEMNKYKVLADTFYFNGKYKYAIKYYEKILIEYIEFENIKVMDSLNLKQRKISNDALKESWMKEIYEKLIKSYMELENYKDAMILYDWAIKELEHFDYTNKLKELIDLKEMTY